MLPTISTTLVNDVSLEDLPHSKAVELLEALVPNTDWLPLSYAQARKELLQLLPQSFPDVTEIDYMFSYSVPLPPPTPQFDAALGSMLGAAVGDASGATLEFCPHKINSIDVRNAMRMPGGGVLKIEKGGITDDTELQISLANALVGRSPRDGMPLHTIMENYREWIRSGPLDAGTACTRAFTAENHEGLNLESKANGALMRSMPIGVFARNLKPEAIADYARKDCCLSHPNIATQDANAAYCVAAAHLIQNPGDAEGAIKAARSVIHDQEVLNWVDEALNGADVKCEKQIGFVRWGFTLALQHLHLRTSFEKAIEDTLLRGGDTDTNAAIVGGLVGALHGAKAIPEFMKEPVLRARGERGKYWAARIPKLARQIFDASELVMN
ncbi:ADP-ribosylation/Crystallin J1 [Blyttiomyces helicus]|uniref:ADP-ribosylation/Crystallin J1 n=1 Tax=Blyttiomyces helicus TaxID=388810 RepID=A0A4P9WSD0_9FUNG|nr:ADP-ribosylation/Crystallin J1 [Blyttiomyces helicus]|eukprot:RKO94210.1 ADP-ribosylation/Crystallin J1 [Blyttiomyces helicus]